MKEEIKEMVDEIRDRVKSLGKQSQVLLINISKYQGVIMKKSQIKTKNRYIENKIETAICVNELKYISVDDYVFLKECIEKIYIKNKRT
ncbi:hypothetical protein KLN18_18695 [Clostridioides difficile]|nr:hypothetical protein [Clostridioides difficile]MDO0133079.1 hypothetical protein [Clostridioides difficile]